MISKGFGFVAFFADEGEFSAPQNRGSTPLQKTGMFGGLEVSHHQTYSERDWLSILRTLYPTQNLQSKHRTDLRMKRQERGNHHVCIILPLALSVGGFYINKTRFINYFRNTGIPSLPRAI